MVAPNDPSNGSAPKRRPVSARKRRANRANAQHSTGPRTPQGKATSSRNATTHGIFCRDLVLPGENFELFVVTRDGFLDALKPQDAAQLAMVDTAVAARWRLNRCQFAEAVLIERRIAAATAHVKEKFESLGRNMRYEDFSAAAINAQCARSEVFRRHFQEWKELRAAQDKALHPGHALAALMYANRDGDQPLDRLSRYEHRLEQTFHRCLRDLHVLKQRAKQYADEPPSPFRTQRVIVASEDDGEGNSRGSSVPPEHPSAATEESTENELGRDAQATDHAGVQIEPTAAASSASADAVDGSDARGDGATPPDPQEMAALRKFTDLLSRCRPAEEDDDGAEDLPPDWRT